MTLTPASASPQNSALDEHLDERLKSKTTRLLEKMYKMSVVLQ